MSPIYILIALLSLTSLSFATPAIVKTQDGHRVLCTNKEDVNKLKQDKIIQVSLSPSHQEIEIQLVRCDFDGWIQDTDPEIQRVDEPLITSKVIYQNFHQYFLYIVRDGEVIQSQKLQDVFAQGFETVTLKNWDPRSEIFVSTLTSKQDDAGNILDEKHEESFGSFNILELINRSK